MLTGWDASRSLRALRAAMGSAFNSIRLNAVTNHTLLEERSAIVKRRTALGRSLAPVANSYFRIAGVPLSLDTDIHEWQQREIRSFRMLNPEFRAVAVDGYAICEEQLPGEHLLHHAKCGTLRRKMLRAAGWEIRRAHQFWSDEYVGRWSHGDAAMRNVIYASATGRARLIDFEMAHDPSLPAVARHADDLRAFLLDLVSLSSRRRWLPYALTFLRAYDDAAVIAELRHHLFVPKGLGRLWWKIRTNFAQDGEVLRRLTALGSAIDQGALRAGVSDKA